MIPKCAKTTKEVILCYFNELEQQEGSSVYNRIRKIACHTQLYEHYKHQAIHTFKLHFLRIFRFHLQLALSIENRYRKQLFAGFMFPELGLTASKWLEFDTFT